MTAHILGGAVIAAGPETGVIDAQHRVFGYANMLICDGSAIPANVGVNASLTITALAERAISRIRFADEAGTGSSEILDTGDCSPHPHRYPSGSTRPRA